MGKRRKGKYGNTTAKRTALQQRISQLDKTSRNKTKYSPS